MLCFGDFKLRTDCIEHACKCRFFCFNQLKKKKRLRDWFSVIFYKWSNMTLVPGSKQKAAQKLRIIPQIKNGIEFCNLLSLPFTQWRQRNGSFSHFSIVLKKSVWQPSTRRPLWRRGRKDTKSSGGWLANKEQSITSPPPPPNSGGNFSTGPRWAADTKETSQSGPAARQ